jgi:hypothetical protein
LDLLLGRMPSMHSSFGRMMSIAGSLTGESLRQQSKARASYSHL